MQLVRDHTTLDELKRMSEKMFNKLVKAVVDIESGVMAVDMGMHADGEQLLPILKILNEGYYENCVPYAKH